MAIMLAMAVYASWRNNRDLRLISLAIGPRLAIQQRWDTSTFWNFYLVGSEYDDVLKERITQKERPVGIFIDKPNHKVWVKSWAELIRESESRMDFLQEKLQIQVSAEEIEDRVAKLKSSILKSDTDGLSSSYSGTGTAFAQAAT
jgi:hypothetical protein